MPTEALLIGGCRVDLSLREIHAPGVRRPARVTPKAIGVLKALLEYPGRVVTREQLLARVWAGTMPTDDVVTQAVTQLRKGFGQLRGEPRFIETIAKHGYRLVAPVVWGDCAHAEVAPTAPAADGALADDSMASPAPPFGTPRFLSKWGGVVLLLLFGAGFGWWLGMRGRVPEGEAGRDRMQPANYRFLTSAPGFELSPALSPDGRQVAYSSTPVGESHPRIYVQRTLQVSPRPLSRATGRFSDSLPVWSPRGDDIAFVRRTQTGSCHVMRASVSGRGEAYVAPCNADDIVGFDWTPDGRGLVFGSARGVGGLRTLDLQSGVWSEVDYDAPPGALDRGPRFSADGKWILFARDPQFGDLWRVPAAGGAAQRLTVRSGELRGWDWYPDGRRVVLGRRVGSESRLYVLDPATGEETDLGIDDAQAPDVSFGAKALVFMRRRPEFGLFKVNLAGPGLARMTPAYESSGRDAQPIISPDGRRLAFNSDRSGHFHLWWVEMGNAGTLSAIDSLHPEGQRPAAWSPDSRSLLVVAADHRGRFGLKEILFPSGRTTSLQVPLARPAMALYTSNPARLLVVGGEPSGASKLQLYDRSKVPWKLLASVDGVSLAQTDLGRGRVLFTRTSSDGLWQSDLALSPGSIRRIDADRPVRERYRMWAVGPTGQVEYLDRTPDCLTRLVRIAGGSSPAICISPNARAATTGFSIGPDGKVLYVALARSDGTDIGLLSLEGVGD